MIGNLFRRTWVRATLIILGVGVLLGLVAALRPVRQPASEPENSGAQERPAFATYFDLLFLGKTGDASLPRTDTPLVRATKFRTGERVGIRVQAAPEQGSSFTMELRFLAPSTREELPSLRDDRQSFRISPGLRTVCCLRMPRETGTYDLAVLVGNQFLSFLPITVEKPSQGGGLSL